MVRGWQYSSSQEDAGHKWVPERRGDLAAHDARTQPGRHGSILHDAPVRVVREAPKCDGQPGGELLCAFFQIEWLTGDAPRIQKHRGRPQRDSGGFPSSRCFSRLGRMGHGAAAASCHASLDTCT